MISDELVEVVDLDERVVEIVSRAEAGLKRFDIRLDPPDLGRIDVRLDVDNNGRVTSRLIVERAETLDLLRRDAPQLERALQQAGLKTDGGIDFSLRDPVNHIVTWCNDHLRNDVPIIGGTAPISDFTIRHLLNPLRDLFANRP